MVAVARMAGLGGRGSGLLVAVWPDGRIIRAREAASPEAGYVEDRLSPDGVKQVTAYLERSGFWRWKQPWIAVDVQQQWTAACVGNRRVARNHTVHDDDVNHPAIRLRTFLMGLPMGTARPVGAPDPEEWVGWVRTDDDDGGQPTTGPRPWV